MLILVLCFLAIPSCHETYYFRNTYEEANSVIHESRNLQEKPLLKAHMCNGDVDILKADWKLKTTQNKLLGKGTRYDFNRSEIMMACKVSR